MIDSSSSSVSRAAHSRKVLPLSFHKYHQCGKYLSFVPPINNTCRCCRSMHLYLLWINNVCTALHCIASHSPSLYSKFRVFSVLDEIDDAGQDQSVLFAEPLHFREAHHLGGMIFRDDLTQYPGPGPSRQVGQVDPGLGVAVSGQDAALTGPQWEDVSRSHEIGRSGRHVRQEVHRLGAVDRTNSGCYACHNK
jgi:hypothetical protein